MDLTAQVRKNERSVQDALNQLSKQVSDINLKQFNNEDATAEIKKYRKTVDKYKKSLSALNTTFKFMKSKNVMTVDETLIIENELKEFENSYAKITKYVNI